MSAQPSKQQRPLLGQSVSLCPGLQQVDIEEKGQEVVDEVAGQEPSTPFRPEEPKAPSTAA